MEQKITEYQRIINEHDHEMENSSNSNRVCSLCFEEYTKDRKQVAIGPCGHSPVCIECFKVEKHNKSCPICYDSVKFLKRCFMHVLKLVEECEHQFENSSQLNTRSYWNPLKTVALLVNSCVSH